MDFRERLDAMLDVVRKESMAEIEKPERHDGISIYGVGTPRAIRLNMRLAAVSAAAKCNSIEELKAACCELYDRLDRFGPNPCFQRAYYLNTLLEIAVAMTDGRKYLHPSYTNPGIPHLLELRLWKHARKEASACQTSTSVS